MTAICLRGRFGSLPLVLPRTTLGDAVALGDTVTLRDTVMLSAIGFAEEWCYLPPSLVTMMWKIMSLAAISGNS
jgi:hypothetical protein